jgi:acyl carrier protein
MEEMRQTIREYILKEFLLGENPEDLTDSLSLVTGGILDSLAILDLVGFLEQQYRIRIEAHEVNVDNFDTIAAMANFVHSKF